MAFEDKTLVLYKGSVKVDYKDKAHRYYARPRIDWDKEVEDPKAWGKIIYPKGTTTLIGDTLEKKGLMLWPMGLALRELFGFYDFTNENGERMTGFSKDVGSVWAKLNELAGDLNRENMLDCVLSASKAHTRKKKKGADIGSVVHNAIEHHIDVNQHKLVPKLNADLSPVLDEKGQPVLWMPPETTSSFDIAEAYNWAIKESEFDNEEAERNAWREAPEEIEQAKAAFANFVNWWASLKPEVFGTEEIVYSKDHNICGTYDAFLGLSGMNILTDFKTTNASASKEAASPEGIYYEYFVQLGIYEMARREMGLVPADDFLLVSCRKDGGFSTIFASDVDLTVEDCMDWAKAVITCYNLAKKTKEALLAHAPVVEKPVAAPKKQGKLNAGEAF